MNKLHNLEYYMVNNNPHSKIQLHYHIIDTSMYYYYYYQYNNLHMNLMDKVDITLSHHLENIGQLYCTTNKLYRWYISNNQIMDIIYINLWIYQWHNYHRYCIWNTKSMIYTLNTNKVNKEYIILYSKTNW
jgi:hypothetical protein